MKMSAEPLFMNCETPIPMRKVRKAVFPVAGLGTRFLPATKTIPKEMLTVVDRPVIQYVVDEAREAEVPTITRTVLGDIKDRLSDDPDLKPGGPVPFYYLRHNRFHRDIL